MVKIIFSLIIYFVFLLYEKLDVSIISTWTGYSTVWLESPAVGFSIHISVQWSGVVQFVAIENLLFL
jgi:hypothetical protein